MTTPSYAELVTAVRREGEGLLAAASLGSDADVPTCEAWSMSDLVIHTADVYRYAAMIVSNRLVEQPDERPGVPEGEPIDVYRDALDEVVAALQDAEPDTSAWNWTAGEPHVAAFWARRMAHESSVHRFDAQTAHGVVQPIDAELAEDGIDELVDVIAPRVYHRDSVIGPTGTIVLASSDSETWNLELLTDGVRRIDPPSSPDAAVTGTTSTLLLACYGRVPWTALAVTGDEELLTAWTGSLNF
ncbi:MAG: maleylpyruvate isomerase family mycothiol-dependent enzyme [Frankiaceae bacterium]|nr:maleylpyruvate isomerase family mycothiol-dependent enzyme [Frankiaceae bacterium]